MTIDLENKMWDIEFPGDTSISVAKQAEIRALFETEEIQNCPNRDVIKQHILFKTGEYYADVLKYKILLKDKTL
jgi:hypothetical protein